MLASAARRALTNFNRGQKVSIAMHQEKNDQTEFLKGLNDSQLRAVTYGLRHGRTTNIRALLVIAGAGSGKTRTLTRRGVYMVVKGMDPGRILLLTFSRRAAEEMRSQVTRTAATALNVQRIEMPWVGTFHAIGAKLIREYADHIWFEPFVHNS